MIAAEKVLSAAFPEFEVVTAPRPDGGLLLTLRNDDRDVINDLLGMQEKIAEALQAMASVAVA